MTPVPKRKSTRTTRDPNNLSLMSSTNAQTKTRMKKKTETSLLTKTSSRNTKRKIKSARNCCSRTKTGWGNKERKKRKDRMNKKGKVHLNIPDSMMQINLLGGFGSLNSL